MNPSTDFVPEFDGAPLVWCDQVNHHFGSGENRKQVLYDVRLRVWPGELVIMTGPSGSGKTTLLTLIGGLRSAQDGRMTVLSRQMTGLSRNELVAVRRGIGFIFQAHNLFESLTALQNVCLPLDLLEIPKEEKVRRASEILDRLGMGHRLQYKPEALSGGQRQRVAIARALVAKPKLILADEPTAALDKERSRDVVDLLQELAHKDGCSILLVTHDNRILDVASRIVNMVDGRVATDIDVQNSMATCEFLSRVDVLSKLPPATLAELSQKMMEERFPAGSWIIRQGNEGDKLYLMKSGSAEVVKEELGKMQTLRQLTPGDVFGEISLITNRPRTASVRAVNDIHCLSLTKEDFDKAMDTSQSFKDRLLQVFFSRRFQGGIDIPLR
ncbi:ATP-binding cassette domain-containing protein [bacterium]|jgi:putative ABC transport system ATP-binding protein|nr:ATP-binding cassette domain-containing protein [bacterium]